MITLLAIRRKTDAHYLRWLTAAANGNAAYEPLVIQRTGDKKKGDDRWESLSEIYSKSKDKVGYGYRIEWERPAPGSKVKQSRLSAIIFDSSSDLLQFLEKTVEWEQFRHNCAQIAEWPELADWRATHVREIIQYAASWPQLLNVVRFFKETPQPDLPLRLLPIEGVDTKFIELHNSILCQLLDAILPAEQIHTEHKLLSKRYGLPEQAPLIECAWNDSALISKYGGFNRLAFPADQLPRIPLGASHILVVENRNSMLQVLQQEFPNGMVIFGGGFGVSLLKNCRWFDQKYIYYWGDLDTHGLAILSQFRAYFPHTRALNMDEETLEAYRHAWVSDKSYKGAIPTNLHAKELLLFERLYREGIRLEQERVVWRWADIHPGG